MKLKVFLAVVLVLVIAGALGGIKALQFKKMMAAPHTQPPETVSSTEVREEKWQLSLNAIATLTAAQGVTITPDIPGTVREIAFESGAVVKQGDLLVKLDVSTEAAQLRAVEAQVKLAQLDAERIRTLRTQNMVSQSELDQAEATLNQQLASADAIKATIEKKTLRAPFNGRLGMRQVNLGEYLEAGKPVVSLQSLAPIYSDFTLPQQELSRLKTGMQVKLTTDAFPEQVFEGKLTAINPEVIEATRNVRCRATFENLEGRLLPGMYARVELILPEERPTLVIPATAIISSTYGHSVYVIESDATNQNTLVARQQFIKGGEAKGDFVAVVSGLKPGQKIASAGVFKLRNNMPVVINNDIQPKASQNPRPPNS